jgi:1-acyl-sn-glycerol-3-phosphate acyltransferase
MNFLSKKRVINPLNENFKKPSVIIANHQSHIDLMLIMLTTPKALIVTNSRNMKSKLYGNFIKYADFINVENSYSEIIDIAKQKVSEGYSIMVFPEGKRSDSGEIQRFHKGAIYMAEQLNLEITPIIFHGVNLLLRKHELFLKRGTITTKIYPRINLSENKFGETTRDRNKGIQQFYRAEYQKLKDEFAQTDFYRDYIIKNFIYKNPSLEWYTKIKTKLEDNYTWFNQIVPKNATITDIGCGYGYLSFMLSLISEKRQITGIDYDEEKIQLANNCAIKNDKINFIAGNALDVNFTKTDVFIINDVLHYMNYDKQTLLIQKCFENISDNGFVIIRDGNTEEERRHRGTKLTEIFSTKILKFNKTEESKLHFISASFIKEIANKNGFKAEIIDNAKFTSNTVYVLRK